MDELPPYRVDVVVGADGEIGDVDNTTLRDRPWVGIRFDCCGTYARVYRNRSGTAYLGRCSNCLRSVRLRVGPGGTNARFFAAE